MPRSLHVDEFNHDEDAVGYDLDVQNEADPVRAGYEELLTWMAGESHVTEESTVLELGSGTGNLTARLRPAREIVCVDVSKAMMRIAQHKLGARNDVRWVESDLLEFFDEPGTMLDVVVSSYAIHHLTAPERATLLAHLAVRMNPGGSVIVGDLMFESLSARREILLRYGQTGRKELVEGIEEEFFWDLETDLAVLRELGFEVDVRRFSELSWGLSGRSP